MRVEIDLRKSSKDILYQITDGIMEINNNGLMIQKIKCNTKTKNIIVEHCLKADFDVTKDFCTAKYVIDDTLETCVVVLGGWLDKRLDPDQF